MITGLLNILKTRISYRSKKKPKNPYTTGILAGLVIGILLSCLFHLNVLEKLEVIAIDLRFKLRQNPPLDNRLAIIGISKKCIDKIGGYPIPREKYAQAIDYISSAGAKSICFDIFFDLPGQSNNNDTILSDAFKRAGNITLPIFTPYKIDTLNVENNVFITPELRHNLDIFTNTAKHEGHINAIPDSDGKIRRIPMVFYSEARYVLPMALEGYIEYEGIKRSEIVLDKHHMSVGDMQIPIYGTNALFINYFNPETAIDFLHLNDKISAKSVDINFFYFHDILSGNVDPKLLKDKIVLIGQTCHGLANSDECMTPFGVMFGLFVQAATINSFLTGSFILRLPYLLNILIIMLGSVLFGISLSKMNFLKASIISVCAILIVCGGSILLFIH